MYNYFIIETENRPVATTADECVVNNFYEKDAVLNVSPEDKTGYFNNL